MNNQRVSESNWQDMTFTEILQEMNSAGQFIASFLVDSEGLPVASVSTDYDTDTASAMAALVRNVIGQVQTRINMAETDEVAVRANDKMRLISRYFSIGDETLILVVVAPPDRPYRKLTNQVIKAIKAIYSS
jgi:predicted regulator of Ras-like GTPase activity (Roadblock/LC7/MglB family)